MYFETKAAIREALPLIPLLAAMPPKRMVNAVTEERYFGEAEPDLGARMQLYLYALIAFAKLRRRRNYTEDDHHAQEWLVGNLVPIIRAPANRHLDVCVETMHEILCWINYRSSVHGALLEGFREGLGERETSDENRPHFWTIRTWHLGWKRFLPWMPTRPRVLAPFLRVVSPC